MKARRRSFHDEYVENRESAVLIDDRILVLSEIGTSILAMLHDEWVDVAQVADGLREVFGPPGGADIATATRDALQNLAAEGLVDLQD